MSFTGMDLSSNENIACMLLMFRNGNKVSALVNGECRPGVKSILEDIFSNVGDNPTLDEVRAYFKERLNNV